MMTTNYGPIDAHTFDDCLARGLGRVVLYLRDHDPKPFRDSILHACGNNLAYDKQVDGTREVYLYDILQATGEIDYYVPRILEMLRSDLDELSHEQLYALTGVIAAHGNVDARRTLYEEFDKDVERGWMLGAEPIVKLDGIDGYLYVAAKLVKFPLSGDEADMEEQMLVHDAIEGSGEDALTAAIATASAEIQAFHKRVATELERKAPRRPDSPMEYVEIRTLLSTTGSCYSRGEWWGYGRRATDEALRGLALDLANERDRDTRIKIVSLFRRRPFEADIAPLIDCAKSEDDDDLRRAAVYVLETITDARIRALALDFIHSRSDITRGLALLAANGGAGDYPMIAEIAGVDRNDYDHHLVSMEIRGFIKQNPALATVPILVDLYEGGRCLLCRYSIVKTMECADRIPDFVLAEGLYDADTDVRQLITNAVAQRTT